MTTTKLQVGYRPTPGLIWPKLEDSSQLAGFEYELLIEISHHLGLPLEFISLDYEVDLVKGICAEKTEQGDISINVAVGALQGSENLERKLDILFPHSRSSTFVLVKKSMRHWLRAALRDLSTSWISRGLLVGGLLFCYLPAFFTTLVEISHNSESGFASSLDNPFLTAAWYAVVTISTVGYGDLSPETGTGKLLAAPMIAFAPLLYVGLVQQLWLTFKNAFFRAHYLNDEALKTEGEFKIASVIGTEAYKAARCDVGCCHITGLVGYTELIEAARTAELFDVLVVDAPVAAYILDTFPMKWSLGRKLSEGLGYSCLVPEDFDLEEEMRQLVFFFHENGMLQMLSDRHFRPLSQ
ncbi:MAG: ion channel [Cyanobacteria bacterium P01_D01_bin.36]